MVSRLSAPGDFKEFILFMNDISERQKTHSLKPAELADKIEALSDAVMETSYVKNNGTIKFKTFSEQMVSSLRGGRPVIEQNITNWFNYVKGAAVVAFVEISANRLNEPGTDPELDELLLNFFTGDNINEKAARYFSLLRFAARDARRCYNGLIDLFSKQPDLVNSLFKELSYVYKPELINEVITEKCPICGCESSEPFYCANQAVINDMRFSPAKLWMKCGGCGNLYAYNFPIQQAGEINGHYTRKNETGVLETRHQLSLYCDIFNEIKQFNSGRSYLEIGVGNGEMLAVALEMGYDVSAVEICREDCENISGALGVDIVWSDFLKYETDKRFDVIIMGDVLEHVSEPVRALEKAHALLVNGGVLWLSTPNYDSAFTRMRKFIDPMWNQKNHFTYFSYDNLRPFLEKTGFEVKRYDMSRRYNGSMELILVKK